ncbi:MAG TPA: hypothetical protein VK519_03095 [Pinirhizobacter sp.]|uniref:hypothetical protein n=1 Tax=Pinirhizobacter sp. TaxID=2950432 RepID=UPI002D0524A4|nr:hypothetical protein [Pinirhizobacter sp.]HMH66886.1 hypothetical protein [Pinirhizobacter sp.]
MDKLSEMRVSPRWSTALIACLDEPPRRARDKRRAWGLGLALVLVGIAGVAGIAAWFGH